MPIYPGDLVSDLKRLWSSSTPTPKDRVAPLPCDDVLQRLLDVAYHASFRRDEGRPTSFSIAHVAPEDLPGVWVSIAATQRCQAVRFDSPRAFVPSEIARLAPAADPVRVYIGVSGQSTDSDSHLSIWGLIDAGSSWWEFTVGESHEIGSIAPPCCLLIASCEPGQLTLSRGHQNLLTLRQGKVWETAFVLRAGPIAERLCRNVGLLNEEVSKNLTEEEMHFDQSLCIGARDALTAYLARILLAMKERAHGGTLLIVPDSWAPADPRLCDRVALKYACNVPRAWNLLRDYVVVTRRWRCLMFAVYDSKVEMSRARHYELRQLRLQAEELGQSLRDCARFTASLASVDGAVVITDKLRLLGFGAEVVALSHTLKGVRLAKDVNGKDGVEAPIEEYGTRHRSAFRFCSSHEDTMAFVISQDGAARAVKRVGPDLLCWPEIDLRFMFL